MDEDDNEDDTEEEITDNVGDDDRDDNCVQVAALHHAAAAHCRHELDDLNHESDAGAHAVEEGEAINQDATQLK